MGNDTPYANKIWVACNYNKTVFNKVCAWRHHMPALSSPVGAPAPPSRRNVALVSHAQYVLMVIAAPALRVKVEVSKAAW